MCLCVYPLFINKIISSIWICVILNNCKLDKMIKVSGGTYKVRNEIETKRNETKRNQRKRSETKRNETKSTKTKRNETKSTKWKRNKTKPTKAKRNQRKQNEINENKTKYDARLLPTHVAVSFIRRGQDLITIEQEHLFSGSLSFSLNGFF
jgi:ATPase subunit of ABC transporter with duplicated ATPase domains